MSSKLLKRKVELGTIEDVLGLNEVIELEYYLLENEIREPDELDGKTAYGIEIVKKINDENVETRAIWNLFCCKENTQKILDKLAVNTVTPVGLPFVIDDIIGV